MSFTLFYTVISLKVLSLIIFEVETKILATEIFPQHTIAGLDTDITFIVLIGQEKPSRWKEINTHTPWEVLDVISKILTFCFHLKSTRNIWKHFTLCYQLPYCGTCKVAIFLWLNSFPPRFFSGFLNVSSLAP